MKRGRERTDYLLLARVRRSLRALNGAIARGAAAEGVTLQEQAFLLGLAAYGGAQIPLADLREELEMDQASASILLRRLVRKRMVVRVRSSDRRAAQVSLTTRGWSTFRRSLEAIRSEIRRAEHRGELAALAAELPAYLRFYLRTRK
ncbi:MAG TPA: MarR family transcriptional regulator [Candidatus Limnocylindria bacterium]|nr:MarR family transcriptional regulator [Candidatus Limnocylindria bacterium]